MPFSDSPSPLPMCLLIHIPVNICCPELLFYLSCGVIFQCYPHHTTVMEQETDFIPNLPEGPLNVYRKQASFDWKKLKLVFDKPEILKLKVGTV
jgi:hypothetical protein